MFEKEYINIFQGSVSKQFKFDFNFNYYCANFFLDLFSIKMLKKPLPTNLYIHT